MQSTKICLPIVLDFPSNMGILDYPNVQLTRIALPEFHSELFGLCRALSHEFHSYPSSLLFVCGFMDVGTGGHRGHVSPILKNYYVKWPFVEPAELFFSACECHPECMIPCFLMLPMSMLGSFFTFAEFLCPRAGS